MTNIEKKIYNSGITLISLVVTIVILIILAGVAINLSLGENGILKKAQYAKYKTEQEEIKEKIELAIIDMNLDKIDINKDTILDYIYDHIHEKLGINKEFVTKNGDPTTSINIVYGKYEYEIDEKGKVTILGTINGKITITSSYNKNGDEGTITIIAETDNENGIKLIKGPNGIIQNYNNKEKRIEITYNVTLNGKYKFTVEGHNGNIKNEIVIVNDLKILDISFDSQKDFLDVKEAYKKCKEELSEEQRKIVNESQKGIKNEIIHSAIKDENSNMWTLIGSSKSEVLPDYSIYKIYNVTTKNKVEEGEWSAWSGGTNIRF